MPSFDFTARGSLCPVEECVCLARDAGLEEVIKVITAAEAITGRDLAPITSSEWAGYQGYQGYHRPEDGEQPVKCLQSPGMQDFTVSPEPTTLSQIPGRGGIRTGVNAGHPGEQMGSPGCRVFLSRDEDRTSYVRTSRAIVPMIARTNKFVGALNVQENGMITRYITHSKKEKAGTTSEREIAGVQGKEKGQEFTYLTKAQVHDQINAKTHKYYSRAAGVPDAEVYAAGTGEGRYIETKKDKTIKNNLSQLPDV